MADFKMWAGDEFLVARRFSFSSGAYDVPPPDVTSVGAVPWRELSVELAVSVAIVVFDVVRLALYV